jgi:hypothetical protein
MHDFDFFFPLADIVSRKDNRSLDLYWDWSLAKASIISKTVLNGLQPRLVFLVFFRIVAAAI